MKIPVRAARLEDLPALVRLRLANAERHIELDPVAYRLPDAAAVRRYFEDVLSPPAAGDVLVFVAESAGDVVGFYARAGFGRHGIHLSKAL